MASPATGKVIPAQLSFLAVYNPRLGTSDETFSQQIVFYYSRTAHEQRGQEDEKLRQVGLAQGMVGFVRSFSNGAAVDSVDTQKSRIVLHELEEEWWILASIDLTQFPAATTRNDSSTSISEPATEYSSREVSPPALLTQQLVRAHAIFRLHHGASLDILFAKHGRDKFCSILGKYWARFSSSWDVLLHGSPAVDMYGGMKLAAGGELGMGVGEEEWGSSERDVLEDFARRTEGLVDVMVSRFGEASPLQQSRSTTKPKKLGSSSTEPWLGSGNAVHAADGVVFSGLGAVSRASLRDMSHWIESIYFYGDQAYGIRDNPTSGRKKRKRRPLKAQSRTTPEPARSTLKQRPQVVTSDPEAGLPLGIPPPIVRAADRSLDKASAAVDAGGSQGPVASSQSTQPLLASLGDTETWMKYMTLGYGTAWGGRRPDEAKVANETAPSDDGAIPDAMRYVEPAPEVDVAEERLRSQLSQENNGYFLIGPKGTLDELAMDDDNDEGNWNHRIPLRTVHVETVRADSSSMTSSGESDDVPAHEGQLSFSSTGSGLSRLRPVVYVHRPFIYTFLFHHRMSALGLTSFYRNIHNFFSPLHHSLDKSTSPARVAARLTAATNPQSTMSTTDGAGPNTHAIYDLLYDPRTLTIHSSIPNIPDPGTLMAEGLGSSTPVAPDWSRVDALNVHSQILASIASTRRNRSEIERTCRTGRGWWVVWMRVPPSQTSSEENAAAAEAAEAAEASGSTTASAQFNTDELREAFLVRRAHDAAPSATSKSSGSRFASGMWTSMGIGGAGHSSHKGGAGRGAKGLGEGIGIDARRYVEELLSLNR